LSPIVTNTFAGGVAAAAVAGVVTAVAGVAAGAAGALAALLVAAGCDFSATGACALAVEDATANENAATSAAALTDAAQDADVFMRIMIAN
jgi:hypothetical protein